MSLPVEQLSQRAFDALPEYSCSLPTGVVIGKVWKANTRHYPSFWAADPQAEDLLSHEWLILEYVHSSTPGYFHVEIRVPKIVG